MTLWAAACAEHVLGSFEHERPEDPRPRLALAAARRWAEGELSAARARQAALQAFAAVLDAEDVQAMSTARAAGHAAAASGNWGYARLGAFFAAVAAQDPAAERCWQREQLNERLRPAVGLAVTRARPQDRGLAAAYAVRPPV